MLGTVMNSVRAIFWDLVRAVFVKSDGEAQEIRRRTKKNRMNKFLHKNTRLKVFLHKIFVHWMRMMQHIYKVDSTLEQPNIS